MTIYKRNNLPQDNTRLPPQLSTGQVNYKRTLVTRAAWDRTFSPSLLNHFSVGYNHDHFYGGGIDGPLRDELPKIKGVARNDYPPALRFLAMMTIPLTDTGLTRDRRKRTVGRLRRSRATTC